MPSEADYLSQPVLVIGHVHTPFKSPEQLPIQGTASDAAGTVALLGQFEQGLADLEGFDRIWLLYYVPSQGPLELKIVPRLDEQARGVFSTRSFAHPNPIGLTCVELLAVEGCTLKVKGVDMLDGVPLLDIKPYVARYDIYPDAWAGWLENRIPPQNAWRGRKRK